MKTASALEPRPGTDLAQVAPIPTDQPPAVELLLEHMESPGPMRDVINIGARRYGKTEIVRGLRHGRLGFGLGGGLS